MIKIFISVKNTRWELVTEAFNQLWRMRKRSKYRDLIWSYIIRRQIRKSVTVATGCNLLNPLMEFGIAGNDSSICRGPQTHTFAAVTDNPRIYFLIFVVFLCVGNFTNQVSSQSWSTNENLVVKVVAPLLNHLATIVAFDWIYLSKLVDRWISSTFETGFRLISITSIASMFTLIIMLSRKVAKKEVLNR